MNSHALAQFLLDRPNMEVVGVNVGQFSNQCGDEILCLADIIPSGFALTGKDTPVIGLMFSHTPILATRDKSEIPH